MSKPRVFNLIKKEKGKRLTLGRRRGDERFQGCFALRMNETKPGYRWSTPNNRVSRRVNIQALCRKTCCRFKSCLLQPNLGRASAKTPAWSTWMILENQQRIPRLSQPKQRRKKMTKAELQDLEELAEQLPKYLTTDGKNIFSGGMILPPVTLVMNYNQIKDELNSMLQEANRRANK